MDFFLWACRSLHIVGMTIWLGVKQLIFVLMAVFAFGHTRMLRYLESPSSNGGYDEKAEMYRHRLQQYRTISIALGMVAVFFAAGMRNSG